MEDQPLVTVLIEHVLDRADVQLAQKPHRVCMIVFDPPDHTITLIAASYAFDRIMVCGRSA